MASSPTQAKHGSNEPAAGSGSQNKAKLAASNLRIDSSLPYKDDDPSTCKLVRGSPVTTVPPPPAKSKKHKKDPSAVPMDSLLAPKSTVFTPPLPFRLDEPGWRPPRFDRGSRPHCPEKLDLSNIPRRPYFVKNGRLVYAARGTASPSPQAIPTRVPLTYVPPARAPQTKTSDVKVPEADVPPSQVSPMKTSPTKTAPVMASAEADPVLGPMPFTDPQSPIYSPSSDSSPEIMTRQRRKRRQNKQTAHDGSHYRQVNQGHCSQASVTENPCDEQEDCLVYQREERNECNCTLCEDCCLILATLGMGMTVLLSVSTAISKVGQWLVSLTPPEEYRRY